ncbi:hypothetical protein BH23GEM4_BH23GEM4_16300 [soil metagenome]
MKPVQHAVAAELEDLDAEYELVGELGRGGMAVVYLARDRSLGREVAVKVIRARYMEDAEVLARFAREARTAAQLHHPNIVTVHSVKRLGDGSIALVMQYVPGMTLKEAINREAPFSFERAERILHDIGAALQHAHRSGIVHRDVKPENIFLDDAGDHALLADFGVARMLDNEPHLTSTGIAIGTPAYMSPEQIDGAEIDGRSDLYSLGLVGWEMLTGVGPWEGEGLYNIIYKQKSEELPRLRRVRPGTPSHLWYAIEGALHKDPEARWGSAREFLAHLDDASRSARWRRRLAALFRPRRAPQAAATTLDEPGPVDELQTIRYRRPSDAEVTPAVANSSSVSRHGRRRTAAAVLLLAGGAAAVISALTLRGAPAPADDAGTPPSASVRSVPAERTEPDASGLLAAALPREGDAPALTPPADTVVADQPLSLSPRGGLPEPPSSAFSPPPASPVAPPAAEAPPLRRTAAERRPAASAEPTPSAAASAPASAAGPLTLVTGGMHTCALSAAGELFCWGGNDRGQLGTGGTTRQAVAASVAGRVRFRDVAAGISHTCGIGRDGATYCWGANNSGQLGNGAFASRTQPTRVAAAPAFRELGLGMTHTCGMTGGGAVFCWGNNSRGQLGSAAPLATYRPSRVPGSYTALAVGWNHACALDGGRRIWCWGANDFGQLGTGDDEDHAAPVQIGGDQRFAALAAGSAHTCALSMEGAVFCWGRNAQGQLGDGSTRDRSVPVRVSSNLAFRRITAGSAHVCGLTSGGRAYCWGRNNYGQLGDGSTTNRTTPSAVSGGYSLVAIDAAGAAHTCGTTSDGRNLCWGYNVEGQLGDGSRRNRTVPVEVSG